MLDTFPPELRWLLAQIKPQLRLHVGSFLCLTAASLLALVMPLSIRWLIDSILPSGDSRLLATAIALIFASYEGRATLNSLGGYLTFRAAQHTALALRMSLLRHCDSLSADYFDRTPVGKLLYAFEAPIDEIAYFGSNLLPSILRAIISAGVTLGAMLALTPVLTFAVIPVFPVFLALRYRYRRKLGRQADLVQFAKSKFSSFLQEHLSALLQIQLLRQTDSQERRAFELAANAVSAQNALWKCGAFFSASSNLAIVTAIALALAGGSLMVFRGALTIGTLVAFHSLLVQLFEPLSLAVETYSRAQRTFASIREVHRLRAVSPAIKEHPQGTLLASLPLHIAFRGVCFTHAGRSHPVRIPMLEIRQGERVAIVGANGAGKSTLVKLLARVYDPESGEITIAGLDVRTVRLDSLRSAVCYLPAQPMLFHRSVAENLGLGKSETTQADMERVLRMVGLAKYLNGFPKSLEADIEPSASNLSNGERQRVAIARTLLHPPQILILDETSSSLDPASEEAILRTIDRVLVHSTIVVVSHRPQSIAWMPRMLVMDKGRIVADRTPLALNVISSSDCRDALHKTSNF